MVQAGWPAAFLRGLSNTMIRTVTLTLFCLSNATLLAQAAWSITYPTVEPPRRSAGLTAFHHGTSTMVTLFGAGQGGILFDGWRLQGDAWSPLPGTLPPRRDNGVMVSDTVRDRLVLFAGGASVGLQDVWEWDGVSWSNPNPSLKPPGRRDHAAAFDPVRGVTIVFGGDGSGYLRDTWEWDGASWHDVVSPNVPPARVGATMAFDPSSGKVLLHGGTEPFSYLNDTWLFDGVDWQELQPSTPPPYRLFASMVADVDRSRVVLLGGQTSDPFTWEWDGSQWGPIYQPSPAPLQRFGMVYDSVERRVVVHGGFVNLLGSGMSVSDTWVYRTGSPASVSPFGAGCIGTAGTPMLVTAPGDLPWLGDTVEHVVSGIPVGEPGAIFASSLGPSAPVDLGVVGMPGCELLVTPDVTEFRAAIGNAATWTLSIPNDPVLAGVPFYQQAFVFDSLANTLGLVASNGMLATLGIR